MFWVLSCCLTDSTKRRRATLMTRSKALDERRESQEGRFGSQENDDDNSHAAGLFREQTNDLRHNAPASQTQIGSPSCQLTQTKCQALNQEFCTASHLALNLLQLLKRIFPRTIKMMRAGDADCGPGLRRFTLQ